MGKMNCALSQAEINHLRRLLAYVDLELGQEPEAMAEMLRSIAPQIQDASPEGVQRISDRYNRSVAVPKYIRAAIKALKKTLATKTSEVVDVDASTVLEIEHDRVKV